MNVFPTICSSAGVPKTRSVPGSFWATRTRFAATAAATAAVPRRLWPQPCPGAPATRGDFDASPPFCERPGSASYSARIPTTGDPEPALATKAVGMPPTPRVTVNPSFSRIPARSSADFVSLSAVSEKSQIRSAASSHRARSASRIASVGAGGAAARSGAARRTPERIRERGRKRICMRAPARGIDMEILSLRAQSTMRG